MTDEQLASLESRVAHLEQLAGVTAPAAPVTIDTQWGPKALKDFPTYADFAQLSILAGGALTEAEVQAWMATTGNGDPRTHSASGGDASPQPIHSENTSFPWTAAGGQPCFFNSDATFGCTPPEGYVGNVTVTYGETPQAGPVPEKLRLTMGNASQVFDGPNVRGASLTTALAGPFTVRAEPLDANGQPVVGQGGSLVLHHSP